MCKKCSKETIITFNFKNCRRGELRGISKARRKIKELNGEWLIAIRKGSNKNRKLLINRPSESEVCVQVVDTEKAAAPNLVTTSSRYWMDNDLATWFVYLLVLMLSLVYTLRLIIPSPPLNWIWQKTNVLTIILWLTRIYMYMKQCRTLSSKSVIAFTIYK